MRADELPQRHRDGMGLLSRNVKRLELLVSDLLDAARLQSGRLRMQPVRTDLAALVSDARASFEAQAEQGAVQLETHCDHAVWVKADADRMAQVLFNLIHNALKFTPEGGRVDVRAHAEGDEAVLAVRDTGAGLPPGALETLFEPFTQFHRDDVGQVGTGLGLHICQGIVEAHGGTIEAHSDGPGRGTTFTIRLPRAEQTSVAGEDELTVAAPDRSRRRSDPRPRGRRPPKDG